MPAPRALGVAVLGAAAALQVRRKPLLRGIVGLARLACRALSTQGHVKPLDIPVGKLGLVRR